MNNILAAGLVIKMIEDGLIISYVMERRKFRSIQKPAAANTIHCKEVPKLFVTKSDANAASGGAERAIRSIHIAEDAPSPEARSGGYLCDETRLVPKFRLRRTSDDLHALDRADRNLCGVDFALLIGYRLSIDNETRLKVVTQRMVQAVGVSRDATGAVCNRLAETSCRIDGRDFHDRVSVDVYVRRGVVLNDRTC